MKLIPTYLGLSVLSAITLTSCTVNMNNISTKGQASDLVDDVTRTDPTTDTNIEIPAIGLM